MNFIADRQTLDDLNIEGKYKHDSIFSLFNQMKTSGGEKLLEFMFHHPLTDPDEINKRSAIFKYFQSKAFTFPFSKDQFDEMETYLIGISGNNLFLAGLSNLRKLVLGAAVKDQQYEQVKAGVQSTIAVLAIFYDFICKLDQQNNVNPFHEQIQQVKTIFADKKIKQLIAVAYTTKLSFSTLSRYDYLLRHSLQKELVIITEIIHYLDVYIGVGNMAAAKGFLYANALSKESNVFVAEELYHPSLKNAVGNNISLNSMSNMIFLTGANMAGKSTLMKTFGIAVYLAHMGFPVAAKNMEFSVKDGIYTSINVPDNLNMGYSHFYAEVLRVKTVAQKVSALKNMVVIFDELFKGTNVKDAYDATLAVTEAFAAYNNCFFIISTHIIEVGGALQQRCENIQFSYLPTIMEETIPKYTYKLENGITQDRQGMIIIENEGILEILSEANSLYE